MTFLYYGLTALHIVAIVVTGILWTLIDLKAGEKLRPYYRDIRAVHFGSLYLVPWFLGLAFAFQQLRVPAHHQVVFPVGLGLLILLTGVAYLFPRPPDLDPFYYWTGGLPLVLSVIGLGCLVAALLWTAGVLVVYSLTM